MSNQRPKGPPAISSLAVGISIITILSLAMASRTGEDLNVWIFVHEWLGRGAVLYRDVWDHKDFGFFLVNRPFFALFGATGLWVAAILSTLGIGLGMYIAAHRALGRHKALLVSAVGLTAYAFSPTFLAPYTENLAVSFMIVGVSVLSIRPMLAGSLLAISVSIKISLLATSILLATLLIAELFSRTSARRHQISVSNAKRVVSGFVLALFIVTGIAAIQGSLAGWLGIIHFNQQYSNLRRVNRPAISDFLNFLRYLLPDPEVSVYLVACLVSLTILAYIGRRPPETLQLNLKREILLATTVTVGSGLALLPQLPLTAHHYGLIAAPLCYLGVLLAIPAVSVLSHKRRTTRAWAMCAALPVILVGFSLAVREDGWGWPVTNLAKWSSLGYHEVQLSNTTLRTQPHSLAFVDFAGGSFDFKSLNEKSSLSCRFFYHLPHLMPFFETEMSECLESLPDVIVVGSRLKSTPEFEDRLKAILRDFYGRCSYQFDSIEVYVRMRVSC